MTDTNETPNTENTDTGAADAKPVDWEARFNGQQKVNRDLEAKLKAAYAKADKVDALEAKLAEFEGRQAEYEEAKKAEAVKADALAAANGRILKANVRAEAAGRLRDPADALRYLDLSSFTVSDDGDTDSTAIGDAITELLKVRPYLAAEQAPATTGVRTVPPSGARDGDREQGQLTRDDLRNMSPAAIDKARREGRLDRLMGRN